MNTKQYRDDVSASIHELAESLHAHGVINKRTMRGFDASCLVPVELMAPEEIKELREREQVSQPVFAAHLNVTKNLVSEWERGLKRPSGPALKLLTLVRSRGLHILLGATDPQDSPSHAPGRP
ncbi:MAG: DNA-binding transcriptional regulator [Desulfovibrio sp.]|nr:DNA-binding transcriptional regulator [Desulfovibrio sp.]